MSHSCGGKCVLTGTSRVGYGFSQQIPEACLKAKSPQAPEWLTSPSLYTSSTRQSYILGTRSIFTKKVTLINSATTKIILIWCNLYAISDILCLCYLKMFARRMSSTDRISCRRQGELVCSLQALLGLFVWNTSNSHRKRRTLLFEGCQTFKELNLFICAPPRAHVEIITRFTNARTCLV